MGLVQECLRAACGGFVSLHTWCDADQGRCQSQLLLGPQGEVVWVPHSGSLGVGPPGALFTLPPTLQMSFSITLFLMPVPR